MFVVAHNFLLMNNESGGSPLFSFPPPPATLAAISVGTRSSIKVAAHPRPVFVFPSGEMTITKRSRSLFGFRFFNGRMISSFRLVAIQKKKRRRGKSKDGNDIDFIRRIVYIAHTLAITERRRGEVLSIVINDGGNRNSAVSLTLFRALPRHSRSIIRTSKSN